MVQKEGEGPYRVSGSVRDTNELLAIISSKKFERNCSFAAATDAVKRILKSQFNCLEKLFTNDEILSFDCKLKYLLEILT